MEPPGHPGGSAKEKPTGGELRLPAFASRTAEPAAEREVQ